MGRSRRFCFFYYFVIEKLFISKIFFFFFFIFFTLGLFQIPQFGMMGWLTNYLVVGLPLLQALTSDRIPRRAGT